MKTPKEDPEDKAARLRERRTAELERSRSVRKEAQGLTGDVRRVYGNRVSMFGLVRPVGGSKPKQTLSSMLAAAQDR